ncbi:MAG: hypothetical protein GTO02_13950 [Candidatus Dadabacteria bacterium]|nr:hypothetical protein [Candidatus Dadabacteria bacterium]NIQ15451.1 hypothetical protein [Candidatus Dadabacteria bacterium]
MKQRLSLAIALLGDTKLLVLDEPTSNLDSESRTEILSLVKELKNKGYTILFSSHRIDEVRQIADIVISMNKGRISSIEDIDNFNLGNDKSNLQMVLNIENGLLDLAVNILKLEGFDNLKVDNSSIFLQLNKINKNIPIQRLLKNKIIIKDMYVKDKNIN